MSKKVGVMLVSKKKRVFLVDDDQVNLMLIRGILGDEYQVSCFNGGNGCLRAFADEPADLVILDVDMPEIDGLETCRRILELEPHCPVIFISAKCSNEERMEGYEAGGYDYISKPCNGRELCAKLNVIFQQQEKILDIDQQKKSLTKAFMEVATGSGEQGVLLQFAVAASEVRTHQELAETLVCSINELNNLKASVLILGQHQKLLWSDRGVCPPIETRVLETLREKGRIYEFNNRMQVNEKHVSALIRNMPDDEFMRGRFRDHIPLMLQVASARALSLDTELSFSKNQQRMNIIQQVCTKLTEAETSLHKHISSFMEIIEDESERIRYDVQYLALSEEQEDKLLYSLDSALKQSLQSGDKAIGVSSRFGSIIAELKEIFQ